MQTNIVSVILGKLGISLHQPAAIYLSQSSDLKQALSKNLLELIFKVIPQILWAIGIIFLTRLAIDILGRLIRKALNRTEPILRNFLIQAAEILILVVGIIAFLNTLGIQATSLVAVLGAAGLAIGLALQNTLSHFAAGIMLISLRPFEVGDFIEGAGVSGMV
ncbi:MAG TPA: mechanosensitive ion channel domain-containing protein, partial [Nostocaceae cyanobacterium]|nr:mechanosensitive ion channel domain-containing protein [Nostocaceae cyanobacterium]